MLSKADPSPFSQLQANSLRLEDGKPVWRFWRAKSNWFWILQWGCWIEFYCWLTGACTCSCPRFITTIFTVAVVIIDHGKGFETSENNYTNVNLSSSLEREEKRQPIEGSFQVGPAIEGKCVSPCFPYHLFSAQCSCCDRSTRSGPLRSVAHSAAGIPLLLQNLQNSKSLKFRWFRCHWISQEAHPGFSFHHASRLLARLIRRWQRCHRGCSYHCCWQCCRHLRLSCFDGPVRPVSCGEPVFCTS